MNIKNLKTEETTLSDLNESKAPKAPVLINQSLYEIVMKTKSKQFQFDCGLIMALITVPLNSKFGLKWHFDNTTSFEGFLTSVEQFMKVANIFVITDKDKKLLKKQYDKQSKKR